MLSYAERLRLLYKIVSTLHMSVKVHQKTSVDFDDAFGLWAKRDISLSEIRKKAWD